MSYENLTCWADNGRCRGWRPARPPHTPGCPWGQAVANHRSRQEVTP